MIKRRRMIGWLEIGAGLTLIGAIITYVASRREEREAGILQTSIAETSKSTNEEVKSLTIENKRLDEEAKQSRILLEGKQDELSEKQSQFNLKQEELTTLYAKYSALQEEIYNQNISKDSMPIIELSQENAPRGFYAVNVINAGPYSITDVRLEFTDFEDGQKDDWVPQARPRSKEEFHADALRNKHLKNINVGTIQGNGRRDAVYMLAVTNPNIGMINYMFNVSWGKGRYTVTGWFKNPRKHDKDSPATGLTDMQMGILNKWKYLNVEIEKR